MLIRSWKTTSFLNLKAHTSMHIGRVSGGIPKTNRLWTLVTVALMVIATPRITTAEAPQPATVVPRSDTLVLCIQSPLDSLDPTNHRSRNTQRILKNIFDSLTTRDNTNKVLPQLAESWHLIDDTEWQFTLRKGVRFHNGQCLTSTDVKYTLERVIVEGAIDGGTSPRKVCWMPFQGSISRMTCGFGFTPVIPGRTFH